MINYLFLFFYRQGSRRFRQDAVDWKDTDQGVYRIDACQQDQGRPPWEDHIDLQGWYGPDKLDDAAGQQHRRQGCVGGYQYHFQHIGFQNAAPGYSDETIYGELLAAGGGVGLNGEVYHDQGNYCHGQRDQLSCVHICGMRLAVCLDLFPDRDRRLHFIGKSDIEITAV